MEILRSWPGYGSTLFDVEVRNPSLSAKMSWEISRLFISLYTVGWWSAERGGGVFGVSRSSDLVMFLSKTSDLLDQWIIAFKKTNARLYRNMYQTTRTSITFRQSSFHWLLWTYSCGVWGDSSEIKIVDEFFWNFLWMCIKTAPMRVVFSAFFSLFGNAHKRSLSGFIYYLKSLHLP